MPDEDRAFIDSILAETLNRSEVLARIRDYFRNLINYHAELGLPSMR